MMAMRCLVLAAAAAAMLTACGGGAPEQRSESHADPTALVEQAQQVKAPPTALVLQPVSFADLDRPGPPLALPPEVAQPRADEGCGFVPVGGEAGAAVFVAVPKIGLIKLGEDLVLLAADSGSGRLSGDLHTRYLSRDHYLQLTEGDRVAKGRRWKGTLTIRDSVERIVYFSAGELHCSG